MSRIWFVGDRESNSLGGEGGWLYFFTTRKLARKALKKMKLENENCPNKVMELATICIKEKPND